jgi:hypothetical protein
MWVCARLLGQLSVQLVQLVSRSSRSAGFVWTSRQSVDMVDVQVDSFLLEHKALSDMESEMGWGCCHYLIRAKNHSEGQSVCSRGRHFSTFACVS